MNVQVLLRELVNCTLSPRGEISPEVKAALLIMQTEFTRLEQSAEEHKQQKMITLFIGGLIFAYKLHRRQCAKVPDAFQGISDAHLSSVTGAVTKDLALPIMKKIGEVVLDHPNTFTVDKIQSQPIPFFHKLLEKKSEVALLIAFYTEHRLDLEHPEIAIPAPVAAPVVAAVVPPSQPLAKQPKPYPAQSSLENLSMQVIGGFIAAMGVAAVACGIVILLAAAWGAPDPITNVTFGVVSLMDGVGLFSAGIFIHNKHKKAIDIDPHHDGAKGSEVTALRQQYRALESSRGPAYVVWSRTT